MARSRRSGRVRLFDIHEAKLILFRLPIADLEEHRKTQTPQRTTPFHPVGSVEHFNLRLVWPSLDRGHQLAHIFLGKKRADGLFLCLRERPKSIAQRNSWLDILETLPRKMLPSSRQRLAHDQLDAFRLITMLWLSAL